MGGVKISCIIPVFNVLNHLADAIDSVLKQDFDSYELLLIDDGSTDGSEYVCDRYAQLYPQKIRVIHILNHGVAYARNLGIEEAQGEYIYFMDSDDFLCKNNVFSYFTKSFELNLHIDLVVQGYVIHYKDYKNRMFNEFVSYSQRIYDTHMDQVAITDLFKNGFMFIVWNKMFRLKIIKDNDLRFHDKQMEDFQFVLDYLRCIRFFEVQDYIGYNYNRISGEETLVTKLRNHMFEDYISIHNQLLSTYCNVQPDILHKIMFPQYYSTILKFAFQKRLLKKQKEYLKYYMQHPLVQLSFKTFHPVSLGEKYYFFLVKKRFFFFLRIINILFK